MKLLLGFAAIVCLTAASAKAGDGQLSNHSLRALGLGGMQAMSDDQGLDIRGLGISEQMNGDKGNYGNEDHKKGEHGKNHEKHHEKNHEKKGHEVCGHQHEKNCGRSNCSHSICNISSLCHIQSGAHKL
jgi:hypothetical protein